MPKVISPRRPRKRVKPPQFQKHKVGKLATPEETPDEVKELQRKLNEAFRRGPKKKARPKPKRKNL